MQLTHDTAPDFEAGPLEELAQVLPAANVLLLARSYYSSVTVCLDAIEIAGREADWTAIKEQAHDLKGISGTFGAIRLQYLAEELEHSKEPDAAFVAKLLEEMRRTADVARGAIENILAADISVAA